MATIRYIKDENENVVLPVTHERGVIDSQGTNLETKLGGKQATLVSGENIKTINGESILGSGDIEVQTEITMDNVPTAGSENPVKSNGIYDALVSLSNAIDNIKEIDSITTSQDGTVVISFSDGNSTTIDLNHVHPQYLKYVYLTDESQMPATPDATTLYLILDSNA